MTPSRLSDRQERTGNRCKGRCLTEFSSLVRGFTPWHVPDGAFAGCSRDSEILCACSVPRKMPCRCFVRISGRFAASMFPISLHFLALPSPRSPSRFVSSFGISAKKATDAGFRTCFFSFISYKNFQLIFCLIYRINDEKIKVICLERTIFLR